MNCDDEELEKTRLINNKNRYKTILEQKRGLTEDEFAKFYKDYSDLYDITCVNIDLYNEAEKEVDYYKRLLMEITKDLIVYKEGMKQFADFVGNNGLVYRFKDVEITEKKMARTITNYKEILKNRQMVDDMLE